MRKAYRVGIVGCGTIGTELAKACLGRLNGRVVLNALYDIDSARSEKLSSLLHKRIAVGSIDALIKRTDLVIEAANGECAALLLSKAVSKKKDIMIMSVGGIIGRERLLDAANAKSVRVYFPSGALAGIDALRSAGAARIDSVRLTTRKPPRSLEGAPYCVSRNINLKGLSKETVIFDGPASRAVKAFPQNINVAALLSLAGIGAKKTRVRIIADPKVTKNIHEVEVRGSSGVIRTRTENDPFPGNPKTSFLAALSAIATLEGIVGTVRYGT